MNSIFIFPVYQPSSFIDTLFIFKGPYNHEYNSISLLFKQSLSCSYNSILYLLRLFGLIQIYKRTFWIVFLYELNISSIDIKISSKPSHEACLPFMRAQIGIYFIREHTYKIYKSEIHIDSWSG
jgi:hypothetical protein